MQLTVTTPVCPLPYMATLSTYSIPAKSAAVSVTITGTDFSPTNIVLLDGSEIPATYISATQLTITIPASSLASPGLLEIAVTNPAPCTGDYSQLKIDVAAPLPSTVTNLCAPRTIQQCTCPSGYQPIFRGTTQICSGVGNIVLSPQCTQSILPVTCEDGESTTENQCSVTSITVTTNYAAMVTMPGSSYITIFGSGFIDGVTQVRLPNGSITYPSYEDSTFITIGPYAPSLFSFLGGSYTIMNPGSVCIFYGSPHFISANGNVFDEETLNATYHIFKDGNPAESDEYMDIWAYSQPAGKVPFSSDPNLIATSIRGIWVNINGSWNYVAPGPYFTASLENKKYRLTFEENPWSVIGGGGMNMSISQISGFPGKIDQYGPTGFLAPKPGEPVIMYTQESLRKLRVSFDAFDNERGMLSDQNSNIPGPPPIPGSPLPQCGDGIDNNNNGLIDANEPGCHLDGNASNRNSYDVFANDESASTAFSVPRGNANASTISQQIAAQSVQQKIAERAAVSNNSTATAVGQQPTGETKYLQMFLNAHGFPVAGAGPGSPGQETDYFGSLTRAALCRWQVSQGLNPQSQSCGTYGPWTRARMSEAVIAE